MAKVVFGVWDDKVIDQRSKRFFEMEESPGLEEFDEFDPGNPITAYLGWNGFFVFDPAVDILAAVTGYIERVASESCGKCTPCRVGSQILKGKLGEISKKTPSPGDLKEVERLAAHIRDTSLCGLGQTAPTPLLSMLKHFRGEMLRRGGPGSAASGRLHTYVTAPCVEECPAKVDVPRYIDYIKDGKFTHSVGVVLQKYPWAATCGRVCVRFCEAACRRTMVDAAVGIKVLKRFVADHERYVTDNWFTKDLVSDRKSGDLKVAVVGTGPAGISAAYHMLLKGYPVDVFEAMTEPGGMAAVGIPNYRLPKDVLRKEVSIVEALGGKIHYNRRLGAGYHIGDLFRDGYKVAFLGIGAQKGKTVGIPGESRTLKGYKSGINFLLYINHYYINMGVTVELGDRVVVVGGGNVAMDCVRSARRMGVGEVHLVYRRSRKEMPADREEVEAAEKEGVIFHLLAHPTKIIAENGAIKGVELVRMALGEPDETGRRSVEPEAGSESVLECDMVIPAIGQAVDPAFLTPEDGVKLNRWGLIDVNPDSMSTSRKGVFAGGDCVLGPATLIEAMAHGEKAARAMDDYLTHGRARFSPSERMSALFKALGKTGEDGLKVPVRAQRRVEVSELDPEVRARIFEEVEKPISTAEAYREAARCMRCYRVSLVATEK